MFNDLQIIYTQLSWDSPLKNTKIKLKLLSSNMLHVYENDIAREITRAIHNYAGSNNKYIFDYYETKEEEYIV